MHASANNAYIVLLSCLRTQRLVWLGAGSRCLTRHHSNVAALGGRQAPYRCSARYKRTTAQIEPSIASRKGHRVIAALQRV